MMRRWLYGLPLLAAMLLGGVFLFGLQPTRNPQELRSMLLGKPMPGFDLPALGGGRFVAADLARGQPVIINFFASWCVPCRAEHVQLMQLSSRYKIPVYGIAWKDSPQNVAQYIKQLGNPYAAIGIDQTGRVGMDFGVAGVPESYIISAKGLVLYRHWGDIRQEHIDAQFLPVLRGEAQR
jgi:cytochrome c biogenesis protein CcmG, thiol:disulfide interchange protein DsbE